jgi:tRNA A-37 threonylcarbamoyl transferase component Bud32/tetratricopeptide (TPR) repeat protein
METLSAQQDRWIGKVVAGKFRLDALIGEGAMGRVYRGEQLSLAKPVAIKMLHKHLGGDPRVAKRFHREARAASRLSHPNSLSIIEFGDAGDGTLFIAMELLEGEALQSIIDREAPFTPARIGELMVQTLRALDEAHNAGIIHRDLKPENVVVRQERGGGEHVKVCDFGIAKIIESEPRSTAITKDGYVCGTPEYMAPEQARGDAIDVRADIYSAGVMLYQLLCGRVPFVAETALGIITKHLMEEPDPPRRIRPAWGIPRSLEQIALKALSKDPKERYSNAREMADAISRAVGDLGERAAERIGEGSYAKEAALTTDEAIAKVVPTAPTNLLWWLVLPVAALPLVFGIWLWVDRAPAPEESHTDAPADVRADPPSDVARRPVETADRVETNEEDRVEARAPIGPADEPAIEEARAPSPSDRATDRNAHVERRNARAQPAPEQAPPETNEAPVQAADPGQSAFDEGRRAMLRGALDEAIARFEEAARVMPTSARVQKELGRAYMRTGNVARGIASYRRYLTLAPDAPDREIVERIIAQHGG